jgi:hypothetical protein
MFKDGMDLREPLAPSIKSNEGVEGCDVTAAFPPQSPLGRVPCDDRPVAIDRHRTPLKLHFRTHSQSGCVELESDNSAV